MRTTILDKRPLIYLWRPLYLKFLAPHVWPLFGIHRNLPGVTQRKPRYSVPRGVSIERADLLERVDRQQRLLLERMNNLETQTHREWAAIERLLLGMWSEADATRLAVQKGEQDPNQNRSEEITE